MSFVDLLLTLVGVLSVLNAVAVVALIRQVGILHLRIQPVGGITGVGGPELEAELQLPASLNELTGRYAERYIVGFVSPTCGVCGPVTVALGKIAKTARADTAVLLIVDANEGEAQQYIRNKNVAFLPYTADTVSRAANVPGSPWVIITDSSGKVAASGGVNTLDNIEEMMAQADEELTRGSHRISPLPDPANQRQEV